MSVQSCRFGSGVIETGLPELSGFPEPVLRPNEHPKTEIVPIDLECTLARSFPGVVTKEGIHEDW